ncbi:MAG: tyrosine-type recombinase/integrase [Deltaproteobacteria bacterium]|nr:tyrosine-type recombinase/integrase [Deltaproteobacteria bacterium]
MACPPNELDLRFPNANGQPLDHGNVLARHFIPALQEVGIAQIRFHHLRPTYAGILIEQGENIKYIQPQLEHAGPTVTLNVYAHLMQPQLKKPLYGLKKRFFELPVAKR